MNTQNINNSNESNNQVNNNLPEWIKAGATVYSTKMWMHGDPFTIDGASAYCDGCMVMTAPNGFGFNIKPEEIAEEFAPVAPAPVDKQGNTVPESELHIGERVILGDFFKTDEPNTEGTIWGKEWDEKACAWSYRIRVAECVYYWGHADQVTRKDDTLETSSEITAMNTRKALCDELCRLLGYQTWEIVKSPCTGKWAGLMDYSLKFEDGKQLYISTGVKFFDRNVAVEIEGYKRTSKEGYKSGDYVRMKKGGNIVRVVSVGLELNDGSTILYLYDDRLKPSDSRDVERHNIVTDTHNVEPATADEKRREDQKELDELREAYQEVKAFADLHPDKDYSSLLESVKARIDEAERRVAA